MLMLRRGTFVFIRAFQPSDPTRQFDSAGVGRMLRGQRLASLAFAPQRPQQQAQLATDGFEQAQPMLDESRQEIPTVWRVGHH